MHFEMTADVPATVEANLVEQWSEIAPIGPTARVYLLSVQAPTWIALLADPIELLKTFGPAIAVFFGKEAAKDAWRNKGKIARACATAAAWPIRRAAEMLVAARAATPERPSLSLHLIVHTREVHVALDHSDTDALAVDLARAVRFAHEIDRVVREIERGPLAADGAYFAELQADGRIILRWLADEQSPQERSIDDAD
jgi:hypothetical protein